MEKDNIHTTGISKGNGSECRCINIIYIYSPISLISEYNNKTKNGFACCMSHVSHVAFGSYSCCSTRGMGLTPVTGGALPTVWTTSDILDARFRMLDFIPAMSSSLVFFFNGQWLCGVSL